jgi:hypothetical protein
MSLRDENRRRPLRRMRPEMVTADRIDCYEPGDDPDWATDLVDDMVLNDVTVHVEMSTHASGYLHAWRPGRDVFLRLRARPTTRAERRQILARYDDRLRDHLRGVLPWSGSIWSVPVWRRPWAAVSEWLDARAGARAVLCIEVEIDEETS